MPSWLWLPLVVTAAILLIFIVGTILRRPGSVVVATYPGAVQLGGAVTARRVTFRIVQWVSNPAKSELCPVVLHLPHGDLGGAALCAWDGPAAAARLGGPVELDVFPFHRDGTVVGVRVGLLPGCPAVEISIAGKRLSFPLSEECALRLLGTPSRRVEFDASGHPRSEGG